jgi:hypothetical protein
MSDEKADRQEKPQSTDLDRRELVKRGAAALVLLPYVVPMVESFTVTKAWANRRGGSQPGGSPSSPASPD